MSKDESSFIKMSWGTGDKVFANTEYQDLDYGIMVLIVARLSRELNRLGLDGAKMKGTDPEIIAAIEAAIGK